MPTEDLDRRLAQEIAAAELEHRAYQFATAAALVREGNSSQEMLRTARRRLQETAVAYCVAHGHAEAP